MPDAVVGRPVGALGEEDDRRHRRSGRARPAMRHAEHDRGDRRGGHRGDDRRRCRRTPRRRRARTECPPATPGASTGRRSAMQRGPASHAARTLSWTTTAATAATPPTIAAGEQPDDADGERDGRERHAAADRLRIAPGELSNGSSMNGRCGVGGHACPPTPRSSVARRSLGAVLLEHPALVLLDGVVVDRARSRRGRSWRRSGPTCRCRRRRARCAATRG